jgi:hypothetical protein
MNRGYDGHDWLSLRTSAQSFLGARPLDHEGYIISLLGYVHSGVEILSRIRKKSPDRTNPDME